MSAWIHGSQLMALVGINRSEFVQGCISQDLMPHNDQGEPIRPADFVIQHIDRLKKELDRLEDMAWDMTGLEREKLVESQIQPLDEQLQSCRSYLQSIEDLNWNGFELPQKKELSNCFFNGVINSRFRADEVERLLNRPVESVDERKPPGDKFELSRSAHSEDCIKKCREIAKKIWDKRPDLTIAGMIEHNEIIRQAKRPDGSTYSGTTIRSWIRDLCPNPKPGRRSGKKDHPASPLAAEQRSRKRFL
jgi:hypothetical protein